MWPLSYLANQVKQQRRPAAVDNSFMAWEKDCSSAIQAMLDRYCDKRDAADEKLFKFMYENSWMKNPVRQPLVWRTANRPGNRATAYGKT